MSAPDGKESLEFMEKASPILVEFAARYSLFIDSYYGEFTAYRLHWPLLKKATASVLCELLGRTPNDQELSYLLSLCILGDKRLAARSYESPSEILLQGIPSLHYDGESER